MSRRNLLLLSGLLVLVHGLSYRIYSDILTKGSFQRKKEVLFQEKGGRTPVWILGDSHPMMALDPGEIPGSFNFASTSENYILNYARLRHLLRSYSKPQIILLPAELHSFSGIGQSLLLGHEMDDVYWSRVLHWSDLGEDSLPSVWYRWWIGARFFPYAGQFFQFSRLWKVDPMKITGNGFVFPSEKNSSEPPTSKEIEERIRSHFSRFQVMDSLQFQFLEKIKNLCHREGIQLILVQFPVSRSYSELAFRHAEAARVDSIWKVWGKDLPVFRFRSLYFNRPELFFDPDHLNQTGAKMFSRLVQERLKDLRRKPVEGHSMIE